MAVDGNEQRSRLKLIAGSVTNRKRFSLPVLVCLLGMLAPWSPASSDDMPSSPFSQMAFGQVGSTSGQKQFFTNEVQKELLRTVFPGIDLVDCNWFSNDSCERWSCGKNLIAQVAKGAIDTHLIPESGLARLLFSGVRPGLAALGPAVTAFLVVEVLYRRFLQTAGMFANVPTQIGGGTAPDGGGPRTECLGYFAVVGGSMSACIGLLTNAFCYTVDQRGYVRFCGPMNITGPTGESMLINCPVSSGCQRTDFAERTLGGIQSEILDLLDGSFDGPFFEGLSGVIDKALPSC